VRAASLVLTCTKRFEPGAPLLAVSGPHVAEPVGYYEWLPRSEAAGRSGPTDQAGAAQKKSLTRSAWSEKPEASRDHFKVGSNIPQSEAPQLGGGER